MIDHIIDSVCYVCDVNKEDVLSKSRRSELTDARKLIVLFSRSMLGTSYSNLARLFKTSHVAQLYNYSQGLNLIKTDKLFKEKYDKAELWVM